MRKSMIVMLAVAAMVASGLLIWTTANVRGQAGGGAPAGGIGGNPFGGGGGGQPGGGGGQAGGKKGPGFGGGGGPGGGGMQSQKPMTWEYRVLGRAALNDLGKDNFEAGLNQVGGEGWELVGIQTNQAMIHSYIFRRPGTAMLKPDTKPAAQSTPKQKAEEKNLFQIFRLKHANANEVAQMLGELLRGSKDGMRIVADAHSNQLLLRGPAQAHIEVNAIVNLLDVPGDAAPPGPGPGPGKKGGVSKKRNVDE